MRRILMLSGALALVFLSSLAPALAQSGEALPLRIEDVNTADYPQVVMVVSVPPQMVGKDLSSDDFTVTESGVERPVTATPVPTDGLEVVLLLDASGSMGGRPIVAAREAAQNFLNAMPEGVEVAVVTFANEPTVLSPFTPDVGKTSVAIEGIRLGKNTALYDGLIASTEIFDDSGSTRRTLVLLSDGGDTASESTLEQAIVAMLDADVSFYAVELLSPEYDAEALARLGVATDGIVVAAEDPDGLSAVFVDVASQIVNRYELVYSSEVYGRTPVAVEAEVDDVTATGRQVVRLPDPPPVEPETNESTAPVESVAEVSAIPSVLRAGSIVVLSWGQSSAALWVGAAAVFVAIAMLLIFVGFAQPKERRRVKVGTRGPTGESRSTVLSSLADQATLLAERTVNRREQKSVGKPGLLERAGIHLRLAELIVISIAGSLAVAAVTLLFGPPWLALVLALLTPLVIRAWISGKATKRQRAFADQLPDVLQLMAGSIRSGFGLMQAMNTVAAEMPSPAGEEFQRVKIETQLGRDTNDALRAMSARVSSEDFRWVVEAIEIHDEVGGDLADILDSVLDTVRDRIRIRRRIQTLSAEGKMSGLVLTLLPVILVFVMLVMLVFFR